MGHRGQQGTRGPERRGHACQLQGIMLWITTTRQVCQANVLRAHASLAQGLRQYLEWHMTQRRVTSWGCRYASPAETAYLGQDRRPTCPCMGWRFKDHCSGSLTQHRTIMPLIKGPARFLTAPTRREYLELHQRFVQ